MNQQLQKQQHNPCALVASPIDRAAMENLMPEEKRMIEAALQPILKEVPPLDCVLTINAIISAAYTRAGFKMPDENTLAEYADEFYKSLLERYPYVSAVEVREALKAGVYGDAGEFTGLNPKTFLQFVRHYVNTDTRKTAFEMFKSKRKFLLQQQAATSTEQIEEARKSYVNTLFESYLTGKLQADHISIIAYELLESKGLIKLSKEEKIQVQDRAIKYYSARKANKRYQGNVKSIGDELTDFVKALSKDDGVKIVCKQYAVYDFFEQMAKEGRKTIFKEPKLLK